MLRNFQNLREAYPVFKYKSYKIEKKSDSLLVSYHFWQSDEIQFYPAFTLYLNGLEIQDNIKDLSSLNSIVFNLGLMELVSYWKACASPLVEIECGVLNAEQISFYKEIYFHGLGEYFYFNKIKTSKADFMQIICTGGVTLNRGKFIINNTNLIPVGGGKDSITTIGLLKKRLDNSLLFIVNPRGATLDTAETAGMKDKTIIINRAIDKKLLELNSQGFLNGHTPFSALLAFQAAFASLVYGTGRIILSNEDSSSEGNAFYNETEVNHQWSKSFKAEKMINGYLKKYICSDLEYFSLLRPFYEIQIGRYFSRQKDFLTIFRSCNKGSKTNSWCSACPKCLFVYIILAPFIDDDELVKIFGINLLDNSELEQIFYDLLKPENVKPFECVGTKFEVQAALSLKYRELRFQKKSLSYLLKKFESEYGEKINNFAKNANELFNHFNSENIIPAELVADLKLEMEVS